MSISGNYLNEDRILVQECIEGNRKSQYDLYNLYAGKMYAICLRYAGNKTDAQDVLQIGFIKIFQSLDEYRGEGLLEGWVRQIFIRTCIGYLRKKNLTPIHEPEHIFIEDKELNGFEKIRMKDLLEIIQSLPDIYRTIVNLYMVEGFSHKEICEMLGITMGTSKSQLSRAKAMLQERIQLSNG